MLCWYLFIGCSFLEGSQTFSDLSWTEMHEYISIETHGLRCCFPSCNTVNILFLLKWKHQPGKKEEN